MSTFYPLDFKKFKSLEEAKSFLKYYKASADERLQFKVSTTSLENLSDSLVQEFSGTLEEHYDKLFEFDKKGAGIHIAISEYEEDAYHRAVERFESFRAYSSRDLREQKLLPPDWIVKDLLARSCTSLLFGSPKLGKSTLARQIAYSIANGINFVDRSTVKGTVLYLAPEEIPYEVVQHEERMQGTLGSHDLDRIHYIFDLQFEKDPFCKLETKIKLYKPDLVVIDPVVYLFGRTNSDKYNEVYDLMSKFNRLAKKYAVHIMCIHHSKKGECGPFDKALGSVAFAGAVFTLISLSEDINRIKHLETKQRAGQAFSPPLEVSFDKDSGLFSFKDIELKSRSTVDQERVLEAIPHEPESILAVDIWQRVSLKTDRQNPTLSRLLDSGKIIRTETGRKGNAYKYSRPGKKEGETYIGAQAELNEGEKWD